MNMRRAAFYFVSLAFLLAFMFASMRCKDAERREAARVSEIAEAVKEQIAREWAAHPVMNRVAISHINLKLIGPDRFAGSVACVLDDDAFAIPLDVDAGEFHEGERQVKWKLRPGDAKLPAAARAIVK